MTIVKKLKLIGYPYKIFKNTCFVQVGDLQSETAVNSCSSTVHDGAPKMIQERDS